MLFVRCIELGCVAYVSIGWVGDEVVVGVGVRIECWWFCVVGLVGGKLMDVGSVVGVVVGSVVGVVVGIVGVVVVGGGGDEVVVGIVVEVTVGGSVVLVVVVALKVVPTGCEGRPNNGGDKLAYLNL